MADVHWNEGIEFRGQLQGHSEGTWEILGPVSYLFYLLHERESD